MQKTVSLIIHGKVQGVFYRQSTKEKADTLRLSGEVSNLQDGTVRIIATGEAEAIEELINWCRIGPPRAAVTDVQINEQDLQVFQKFRIVR